jgi:peptide/nickel transport system substrate-binding protein
MSNKIKQWVILFSIICLVFGIAGCSKSTNTAGKTDPKSIVLGIENESEKLNPLFNDEHDDAVFLIFSGLVRFNEKNEAVPDLAKSWDVSPDKLTYTFYLRNDVKWHDGKPFTAEDVKFTIEQILNPKNNAEIKFKFEEIESVEVVDPYQVKIKVKAPFPPLVDVMATGMIPKHLLEGKDINNDAFNQSPVGTGPYKLGEWKKGQYMTLVANKEFYRGAPKNEKAILKFIPNQSVRAVQLETGEIDVALIDPAQMERIGKVADLKTYRMTTADYRVMMYNMKSPLWQDVRVRQALNYAVNRDAMVKGVLLGWGKPAYGPLQLNWANNPNVTKYDYNPEKAKRLLAEAGWTLGADGVFQKDGKRLSFKMTTFAHDPVRVAFINALSTEFKKIGVEAIPDPREKGSFKIGEMETFLLGWGSPFDPDDHTYRLFHSSQIKDGWNLQSYKNAQVDDLLLKARTTDDKNERLKLYTEFQNVLASDPPYNFLAYLDAAVVANKNVAGIKEKVLGHHGAGYIWNVEEWSKQ